MRRNFLSAKLAHIAKRFEVDTQKIRGELIQQLKSFVDDCLRKASECEIKQKRKGKGRRPSPKQQQIWIRTAAYVSQVINSISKTYDLAQIKCELEELKRMVRELEVGELAANQKRNRKA